MEGAILVNHAGICLGCQPNATAAYQCTSLLFSCSHHCRVPCCPSQSAPPSPEACLAAYSTWTMVEGWEVGGQAALCCSVWPLPLAGAGGPVAVSLADYHQCESSKPWLPQQMNHPQAMPGSPTSFLLPAAPPLHHCCHPDIWGGHTGLPGFSRCVWGSWYAKMGG